MPAIDRIGLGSPEALDRHLAGGAVHPLVGDLARPLVKVRLERRPALETAAGNRVLLDVTDAALVLPLRSRPIWCAGPRPKPPVPGEGMQSDIELDLAGLAVVPDHQPSIVVEQHLFGDAAEVAERTFQPGEPAFLALVAEGPDIQPTRIAERGDEQVHLDALAADQRPALAEVDLQLLAPGASRSES
jgi:hypothetical protein